MPSRLRSTVAAALLLAPAALTFLAEPAAAQQRAASQPAITNMVLNSDAGLSPGATLRVQVQATPNAKRATISLGEGVTVPLQQQGPGQYSGSYVVRRSDRIDPMQLMTARFTYGERVYSRQFNFPPAFQALSMGARGEPRGEVRNARRDQESPDILDLMPANGERVGERGNTRVGARLADAGSGIDPDSVRLRINGRDVSADARVTDDRVVLREDLDPGRYTAEVTVRDKVGNLTRKSWNFEVVERGRDRDDRDRDRVGDNDRRDRDRDRVAQAASGPLPLQVTSHGDNMVVDANGNLLIRGRTVPFATVRLQVDSVVRAPGMYGVASPVADRTVQADGNGHFEVHVNPRGMAMPGTRYDVRVTATSGSETAQERLTLLQRG
jgi:hypothetical protein